MERCLISATSNKYFPSVLNLIGSLKVNYPEHPPIFIYDLGLNWFFRKQLEKIESVKVLALPRFCSFWESCYTWKTYIFVQPLAELNFYLDAGTEILGPLDEIFNQIIKNDYFALTVDQNLPLAKIVPTEFKPLFNLAENLYQEPCLAAGIFGFKKNSRLTPVLDAVYDYARQGLTLGFSPSEAKRNKGRDKNSFTRHCPIFRHDQTILNLVMRKEFGYFFLNTQEPTDRSGLNYLPTRFIRILGRYYDHLDYVAPLFKTNKKLKTDLLNLFFILKKGRLKIKKAVGLIS